MQYLTAAETAERLGVKRETVYAYVSRGLLTSVRSAERRGSRFAQDEVERLAARGRDADPPSGAVERIRTAISLLSGDGLYYRGVPATVPASLEEAAGLLWGTGPRTFAPDPGLVDVARAALAALPTRARLTDRIRLAVAAAAAADPLRADVSTPAVTRTADALIGTVVAALDPAQRGEPARGAPRDARHDGSPAAADEPIAARVWPVLGGVGEAVPAAVGAGLVLLADHGLAVSTLAVRVAASARADVYAVVSAGLGALDGPGHGLVSSMAHRFLAEARPDPLAALAERLRAGERVPGFGHAVYRGPDPRATALFGLLRDEPAASEILDVVDVLIDGMARGGDVAPNIDLALAAMMHVYGLRPDAGEAMFALARTVGWVAHALEEYGERALRFRPAGVYVGPRPD